MSGWVKRGGEATNETRASAWRAGIVEARALAGASAFCLVACQVLILPLAEVIKRRRVSILRRVVRGRRPPRAVGTALRFNSFASSCWQTKPAAISFRMVEAKAAARESAARLFVAARCSPRLWDFPRTCSIWGIHAGKNRSPFWSSDQHLAQAHGVEKQMPRIGEKRGKLKRQNERQGIERAGVEIRKMDGACRKTRARHQPAQRHHAENAENGAREHVARGVVSEIYSARADHEQGPQHLRCAEPSRAVPQGSGE